jgi:septin family protein
VGRFGSGKWTFLNTLAGVHWKYTNCVFEHDRKTTESNGELFKTSRSAKGCTIAAAVGKDITTFDGRKFNVIDTIGYDDSVNSETIYKSSSLTNRCD